MKLLSIRLHPFGGTTDRSCTLGGGLNVLEGPNEFGKSTLSQALWHGLFTPTNLTPAKLRDRIGRWYPRPGGDHARVTLEFESGGRRFTLRKTWGAGTSSLLDADGGESMADPTSVQRTLLSLLQRNEATWRHVLFTSQAQLARTIGELKARSNELDDVQSLLAGAAAIPGDIAGDKLEQALEARIAGHFSRWSLATGGPEKGRGIDNPWAKGVGPLLAAYYERERVRRKLDEVRRYEEAVDEANREVKTLADEMAADAEFVANGRALREGLSKREGLEERCKRLAGELKTLKQVMVGWPGAEQKILSKEDEQRKVVGQLEAVQTELRHATQRARASELQSAYGRIVEARSHWQAAAERLAASRPVDPERLATLGGLEAEITQLGIEIAAQKLNASVESATPVVVTIERGTGDPEELTLTPVAAWQGEAEGKFQLSHGDLRVMVESGTGDVAGLFDRLAAARRQRDELLRELGHDSHAAAEQAGKSHRALEQEEKAKKDLLASALQGRSEDEWKSGMDALAKLPESRSVEVLQAEQNRLISEQSEHKLTIESERRKVGEWVRDYGDADALTERILATTSEAKAAEAQLAGLPDLPAGFASIADYLAELGAKERRREQLDEQLDAWKLRLAELTGAAPDSSAEELQADLETCEREFRRQHAHGEALLRIRGKLATLVAGLGREDPLQGLADAVSRHFETLSCGRYTRVRLEDGTPAEVTADHPLAAGLLSQGTLGSLALATRLALSELYLKGMDGFLLLDDPFTDMDHARRRAAAGAIGAFAECRQVLFFTCHPDHASELQAQQSASALQVVG
ncbi:MAG: ATP-binding protein [Verrucomicrobiota bacterium JB025]|nr:AAA family ATPase [Verrucomicrobiota bacterium JB025]